jgi:site-specific DNA recombinase
MLSETLYDLGLRNRGGGQVTVNGLSTLLRNPFYMGYVFLRTKDKLYPGVHEPLVTKELFFKVQARLKSRTWPRRLKHRFKYSRMFRCGTCGRSLVASQVKGHVYYRCATVSCPTTSFREETLELFILDIGIEPTTQNPCWAKAEAVGFDKGRLKSRMGNVSATTHA